MIDDYGIYEGDYLCGVTFPLGGIGTGHFCIGGDGGFRQWQIFNQVNHIADLPGTFLAVRTRRGREEPRSRVLLCADTHGDAEFEPAPSISDHLVPEDARELARRLPKVGKIRMRGRYPIVEVEYIDEDIPLEITLEAFSPMIPLDVKNSGIPGVFLIFRLTNNTSHPVDASLLVSLKNAIGWDGVSPISGVSNPRFGGNRNILLEIDGASILRMDNPTLEEDHPGNGQMCLATASEGVTSMPQWEDLDELWSIFERSGQLLPNRTEPSARGRTHNGALCRSLIVEPGKTKEVLFLIGWYFPNRFVNWDQRGLGVADQKSKFWLGNRYNGWFSSVQDVVKYAFENLENLRRKTEAFREALYSSTIPAPLLDAVATQMSIIRSPTCFMQEDGKFFGFEGCRGSSTGCSCESGGCCPLNCTHVWNYEQSLSRLYPELERTMREVDLKFQMGEDGRIPHRTVLPLYLPRWHQDEGTSAVYAADGHCGTILKTYREYRISGDAEFLKGNWSNLKRALQYAIDTWDPDEDGIFDGPQWNTYDCHLYGHNSFVSGLYLASLRAMEELAAIEDEPDLAERCRNLFQKGSSSLDKELWNGDYYVQAYDRGAHGETQYGIGCHSDQLLGQWWAHQLDLGYILPRKHVKVALESIFRHNFRKEMEGHVQKPRTYLKVAEGGLLICTWPRGERPDPVTLYSDEVWTGIEYAVAGEMLFEGMLNEAIEIVRMARSRHDGRFRSPWNDVECGDHYARAMSSWVLLEAYSGFRWNAGEASLVFSPVSDAGEYRTFFITGEGWGTFGIKESVTGRVYTLGVNHGTLRIRRLGLPSSVSGKTPRIYLGKQDVDLRDYYTEDGILQLDLEVKIEEGELLKVEIE
ncbi:MAG: hypothetical protein HXS50_02305 [Theionarchaea archaeon]|nr:hypothetical protein [Theionarchaea archaeon]